MSRQAPRFSRRQTVFGLGAVAAGVLSLGAPARLLAQTSDKLVRFILPVSPGSGVVGTAAMVKSAPDGLTLSMVSNNHVIYPSVLKLVPFDPVADITPIAVIGATPLVLVVNPKVPAKNMKELVALFKANPGKYNYASSGNGTILHLAAEMFKDVTGTFVTTFPTAASRRWCPTSLPARSIWACCRCLPRSRLWLSQDLPSHSGA